MTFPHGSHAARRNRPPARRLTRALAALPLALGVALVPVLPAAAAGAVSEAAAPGCAPDEVAVVVDLTDLGGTVEQGCAPAGGTGTEVLQAAGFTDTRDGAGMICAIDALPDPCPTTWEGVYWSYWTGSDGTWTAWTEGSDTAVPEAGTAEGWRYNDGSVGPGVPPPAPTGEADTSAGGTDGTEDRTTDGSASPDTPDPATTTDEERSALVRVLGGAAVLALIVAAVVVARRRAVLLGDR